MKTINCRGDLTDISGKKEALVLKQSRSQMVSRVISLQFQPKYRLGHPENWLFLLSKNVSISVM